MYKFISIAFGILTSALIMQAAAQSSSYSLSNAVVSDSMVNIYFSHQKQNLPIYNGKLYRGYNIKIENHAFYLVPEWQTGNILYEGIWYKDMPLRYDIYNDQVIIQHPNSIPIILYRDRVSEFQYGGLHFVHLKSTNKNDPPAGFYQVAEKGKATLMIKRAKIIEENLDNRVVLRKFITAYKYYLVIDGKFIQVRSKNSVLNALKDKRHQITQELKKKDIRFKTDPEKAILHIVNFYNQLHH